MTQEELNKLTPEEKRVKIAEACGYERLIIDYESFIPEKGLVKCVDNIYRTPTTKKWWSKIKHQEINSVGNYFIEISTGKIFADFNGPDNGINGQGNFDYLSDLNAMHEAEKAAIYRDGSDSDLACDYLTNLVITSDCGMSQSASAAQRAAAFLLTL